jgi:hypothetical protein
MLHARESTIDSITSRAPCADVLVVLVDPKYTSQSCHVYGSVAKQNRRSQAVFSCTQCEDTTNVYVSAALHMRYRALIRCA